jgi:hypothetical protein
LAGGVGSGAPRVHRRPRRVTVGLSVLALGSLAIAAGCGGNPDATAKQACQHVERSLRLYAQASSNPDPAAADRERVDALVELRTALPLASVAAAGSGQWEALRTTLSESPNVDESRLVPALTRQCQSALAPPSARTF